MPCFRSGLVREFFAIFTAQRLLGRTEREWTGFPFMEGFSLHANTHLHANDRQRLERLCRYEARGALALERLSRAEDGRIAYRMKRPLPDGTTHLLPQAGAESGMEA
jgi:Putative transposase